MTDETTGQSEATPHKPKPSELLGAASFTDEERAEVDARLNDPNRVPRKVEWLNPGRQPLGHELGVA